MPTITVSDISRLLNAFRATLEGTCSPSTPAVPATLGGYLIDPKTGLRRPLGETRRMLLSEFNGNDTLTPIERSVVSLYFGLELAKLPATSGRGRRHSIASLLPPQPSGTGRPRKHDHHVLGANGVRYVRSQALEKLARRWSPLAIDSPVLALAENDPGDSAWFRRLTNGFGRAQIDAVMLLALRRARMNCGPDPEVRRQLWLDIDWWEHRNRMSPLSCYGVGRPAQPINRERYARACARMSIALWDVLSTPARPPVHPAGRPRQPVGQRPYQSSAAGDAARSLLRPPAEIQDVIMLTGEVEAAQTAIGMLEKQVHAGLSDPDTAYLLAWLEPFVLGRLSPEDCGRGAAVLTRAAADHAELTMVGLNWYEVAVQRRVPARYLAETALNLSVAFSSRRRYREAQETLDRLAPAVRDDRHATVLLRIGQSAWRRRILSEALESGRGFDDRELRGISRGAIEEASAALRLLEPDEGRHPVPFLRAEIRLAEALALTSALLDRSRGSTRVPAATLRAGAERLRENAFTAMEMRRRVAVLTAYDEARLGVIDDVAAHLETGDRIISFGVLRRVKAIQQRDAS